MTCDLIRIWQPGRERQAEPGGTNVKRIGLTILAGCTALMGQAVAQDFDLDALIEAARAEPPLTVFDSTGKIIDMAEAFAAKYGIEATGT